jgi:hypothetical protein
MAAAAGESGDDALADMRAAFTQLDTDHDGRVTYSEVRGALWGGGGAGFWAGGQEGRPVDLCWLVEVAMGWLVPGLELYNRVLSYPC